MDEATLTELVGVYHANGSLRGELAYVVGKVFGRTHCALCDITHGAVRRKSEFDRCAAQLPVPFTLVHLDERDPGVLAASGDRTPCVLGRYHDGRIVTLLGPDDLERCESDPVKLQRALEAAIQS